MLESHGGDVSLVEFTDSGAVILQFGGGCQGCGMVDVTLKDGIEKTLLEVKRCTRDDIRINVFMLDATPYLTRFIEHVTKMNGGRAFFTTNQSLGDYLLVDFVEQRRSFTSAR